MNAYDSVFLDWRKSTLSGMEADSDCVEVALIMADR